ncbi:MAG: hypothetical protein EOO47_09570, partial [Flavobacterium sp.]
MQRFSFYMLIVLLFCLAINVYAGVNIKNGNFYISYTDHSFKDKGGFELERTYDSKAIDIGIFGFGWGSIIEDRLVFIGDGNIVLKYGGGASGRISFLPRVKNQYLINQCINQLIAVMVKSGDLKNTPISLANEKAKLLSNDYRTNKWLKYANKGIVKTNLKPYGNYYAPGWSNNTLTFYNNTFTNNNASWGEIKNFDTAGNFISMHNKNNELLFNITYEDNKIQTLTDGKGNKFDFEIDVNGRVARIKTSKGESKYEYDDKNNLIESIDIAKNLYKHQYDKSHNMTKISYVDDTSMQIAYDQSTFFVSSVTNRDRSITQYDYKSFYASDGSIDDNHYATWVLKKQPNSASIDTSYYEYHYKKTSQGTLYLDKFVKREGKDYYESKSNALGNVVWFKHNSKKAYLKHNKFGALIEKETAQYLLKVNYDEVHSQIAST